MEIERKYLIDHLPEDIERYNFHLIEQGYLNTHPVVRIRKSDEEYYLTYKGGGMMAREEYNLPLNEEAYLHMREKIDGNLISKKRYLIPLPNPSFQSGFEPPANLSLTIELDQFYPPFAPLLLAEVEFDSIEMADAFIPPAWFGKDVTLDKAYHNSNMSKQVF